VRSLEKPNPRLPLPLPSSLMQEIEGVVNFHRRHSLDFRFGGEFFSGPQTTHVLFVIGNIDVVDYFFTVTFVFMFTSVLW